MHPFSSNPSTGAHKHGGGEPKSDNKLMEKKKIKIRINVIYELAKRGEILFSETETLKKSNFFCASF